MIVKLIFLVLKEKEHSDKQLKAFDVDNDGKPFEPEDFAALRAIKKITKEELKGGQKKLDKNNNDKIDAHDFKLLRKQKQILSFSSVLPVPV